MTRRINYEDDIFTLALQVRCLQDTLKLEIDPELFRERILGARLFPRTWPEGLSTSVLSAKPMPGTSRR